MHREHQLCGCPASGTSCQGRGGKNGACSVTNDPCGPKRSKADKEQGALIRGSGKTCSEAILSQQGTLAFFPACELKREGTQLSPPPPDFWGTTAFSHEPAQAKMSYNNLFLSAQQSSQHRELTPSCISRTELRRPRPRSARGLSKVTHGAASSP